MSVLLVGMLDTKGVEFQFDRDLLGDAGVGALVLDAGVMGQPPYFTPNIPRQRAFAAMGTSLEAVHRGCAIECRINAEDPAFNFRPSPGLITRWQPPGGPGVRLDSHAVAGYRVPPNYDSLVAKLLVYQPTRADALACMRRALDEFVIEGIHTTIPIHREIMRLPAFRDGQVDTTFIERTWQKKA